MHQGSENNSSFVGWPLLVSPVENPQNSVEWFSFSGLVWNGPEECCSLCLVCSLRVLPSALLLTFCVSVKSHSLWCTSWCAPKQSFDSWTWSCSAVFIYIEEGGYSPVRAPPTGVWLCFDDVIHRFTRDIFYRDWGKRIAWCIICYYNENI